MSNKMQPRHSHNAIWTRTEMIIWGGEISTKGFGDTKINSGKK